MIADDPDCPHPDAVIAGRCGLVIVAVTEPPDAICDDLDTLNRIVTTFPDRTALSTSTLELDETNSLVISSTAPDLVRPFPYISLIVAIIRTSRILPRRMTGVHPAASVDR